ncbi:RNA dependent RNA polymerase-domain-containing protein [Microdochium trichocladiopsis]|uniref:RNA-dependent RNA polymerase n=1 Tax=Microdochium trichocladiopsis TaxID=1682393 RepID=A0A9P8YFP4_9PEZI|nr:RNA dependent RNA polymerase-domain-containing protein [Microdochium trichocladiopsis]KAH7037134.1 RNA dependent RNA polymerase-domain-containing protein [Microdochium trichocladiopsis]
MVTVSKERSHGSSYQHERPRNGERVWRRAVNLPLAHSGRHGPIVLHEKNQIDFGRWRVYRFDLPAKAQEHWRGMKGILVNHKVNLKSIFAHDFQAVDFQTHNGASPSLWQRLDRTSQLIDSLTLLDDDKDYHLSFSVRYLLEACLSLGVLHEDNITSEFLRSLRNGDSSSGQLRTSNMLAYIATKGQRWWEPMDIFKDRDITRGCPSRTQRIPEYCCLVRKAVVTPTTIYFSPPTVETSHRILREYKHHQDHFLRIQFLDEKHNGSIRGQIWDEDGDDDHQKEIWDRITRTLREGIRIGGHHYRFLAYGNSQLRESSALFFCDDGDLTCEVIRQQMGTFNTIRNAARYAARMGQCLSTTKAPALPYLYNKVDIVDTGNEWVFTDGVGKISPFLATEIIKSPSIKLSRSRSVVPSAFQFRLGGSKGLLVVWDIGWIEVHLRPSQVKFESPSKRLEIIKVSRTTMATLNRQTITILSSLGVRAEVFLNMLAAQISDYDRVMTDSKIAQQILEANNDENGVLGAMSEMIGDGFMDAQEPFMLTMLDLWRTWCLKQLKDKGRLHVKNGAFVFGGVDETNTLRGWYRESTLLPQVFLQVPNSDDKYEVITGLCIVGRNPTLHPGDIRLVEAVDIPALRHLHDLVVFPAQGDRDIPSMCSGGDLDGDEYFVIWDHELVQIRQHDPMEFRVSAKNEQDKPVTINDVTDFLVNYMKNNCLGIIAHAHLANADQYGAGHPKCLELAALHSQSVDFNKTGIPAKMKKSLQPVSWPHFMEKRGKSHASQTVLGQIYDRVAKVDFQPRYSYAFDARILRRFDIPDELCAQAEELKAQYDIALQNIMNQYGIATEFEVWSTFVLSKPAVGSDYKTQETIGLLRGSLIDNAKAAVFEHLGSQKDKDVLPFVAACYSVTNRQVQERLTELSATAEPPTPQNMPYISFPWLFDRELGILATGTRTEQDGSVQSELSSNIMSTRTSDMPQKDVPASVSASLQGENVQIEEAKELGEGEDSDTFEEVEEEDANQPSPAWIGFGAS